MAKLTCPGCKDGIVHDQAAFEAHVKSLPAAAALPPGTLAKLLALLTTDGPAVIAVIEQLFNLTPPANA